MPPKAVVAVISKGDPVLLELNERRGWHSPQDEQGTHAGYYPSSSAEAIAMLERLRAKGADILVVPGPALWWLDHYGEFAEYLRARFPFVSLQPATCAIVNLRDRPGQHRM